MRISEAVRGHPASVTGVQVDGRMQRKDAAACGRVQDGRRELDSHAAGRVYAAEVLQRIAVVRAARVEHSGIQTAGQQGRAGDPFGDVAAALRAALAGLSKDASDAVPGLLREVDAGVGAAEKSLARMGYGAEEIARASAHFRVRVGGLVGAYANEAAPAAAESAAVRAAQVRTERASIELRTQDGDVVRIRFRSREAEQVEIAGITGAHGAALSARIATQQSARLKVAVHGDLDAGELKAIEDFLGKVDALATEFYAGDVEAAFAAAAQLELDAGEIARYAVKLSLRERTSIRAQVSDPVPAARDVQPPWTGAPANAAAPAAPSAAASQPSPQPGVASDAPQARPDAEAASAKAETAMPSASPAAAQVPAKADAPAGLDTIRSFVQRVLTATQTRLEIHGVALEWKVRIELTAALFEAARPDAGERPGARLLGEVLESAAAAAADEEGAQPAAAA